MNMRQYTSDDLSRCLTLFESNVPEYFSPSEHSLLEHYLRAAPKHFYVLENGDSGIVACGGFDLRPDKNGAKLRWDIVLRSEQRRGLGSRLLTERLEQLSQDPTVQRVLVDTSQFTAGFYKRMGFALIRQTPDGIAPGFDDCELHLAMPFK
jgi:N-acetylglutamate synthase-like GNAT family acetyltransferase